jgi:polar amino acid transport system permease protein
MDLSLAIGFVFEYRQALLKGLLNTLYYTGIGLTLGLTLGFIVSFIRQYGHPVLRAVATAYVEIFRGTPVLIQLFWFFFCLPAILGVDLGSEVSTIMTLTLFMGALSSESFRSAMRSIGAEQRDACVALGLPARITIPFVILPQTLIRAVPTLLSNCVTLFKESALLSAVGMADLMYQGQMIADSTARPVEILTATALIYFVIGFGLTRIVSLYERNVLARIKA